MAQGLNRLTVRQVTTAKPGRHADGGGLYLRVKESGSRSWAFLVMVDGKRSEIGLGSAAALSLAAARGVAAEMREAVALGRDPRLILTPHGPDGGPTIPTFGTYAETYISGVEAGWKNAVHCNQWRQSLRDHAASLSDRLINEIDTDAVLAVLRPLWMTKPETAKRLRGRIEKVLDAAKANGLRPRDSMNPAAWRGHLALLLPSQAKLARGHHAALPWQAAPSFMAALRSREALAARCLEFVILTVARSGEALGATWGEIDLDRKLWTVPASRMKANAEHIVPLSEDAVQLLEGLRPSSPANDAAVFGIDGARRSNMAMAMLLRRMRHDITTHGFRSTFRDWAGDTTEHPREIIEQALAHTIQNKAEAAYRRGTAVERRRKLMEDWAEFLKAAYEH